MAEPATMSPTSEHVHPPSDSSVPASPDATSHPDPVKETHQDEQKETPKKSTLSGAAKRPPTGTVAASRTGTNISTSSLHKPSSRSTVGTNTAAATRKPDPASKRNSAKISTVVAGNHAPGTPEKKSSVSSVIDRRSSLATRPDSAASIRRAPTSSATITAGHKPTRPSSISSTTNVNTGRRSATGSTRDLTSPKPGHSSSPSISKPGTPKKPAVTVVGRPGTASSAVSATLKARSGNAVPPASAGAASSIATKELADLKIRIEELEASNIDLEEKNLALEKLLADAKEDGVHVNGNQVAYDDIAAELAQKYKAEKDAILAELQELRAQVLVLEETIAELKSENEISQQKNLDLTAEAESAAANVKSESDHIAAKHAEEIDFMQSDFSSKEQALSEKIIELERNVESLKGDHAEQLAKLANELHEAVATAESKTSTEKDNWQKSLEAEKTAHDEAIKALNAALETEKAASSDKSSSSEELVAKLSGEIESREREITALNGVIKSLQNEIVLVAEQKQIENEKQLESLKKLHEIDLQEAKAKLEKLTVEHQAELEQGSSTLAAQLQELKTSSEVREQELLQQIEVVKKEAAEAIDAAIKIAQEKVEAAMQENEAQKKEYEEKIEFLNAGAIRSAEGKDKEWEAKLEELKMATEEQTKSLTNQLDALRETSEREKEELLKKLDDAKKESDEAVAAAVEKGSKDVDALEKTLCTLKHDLSDKDEQLVKLNSELEKNADSLAAKAKEIVSLEEKHDATLLSQQSDHETEIEALERNLTEKYASLHAKYEELLNILEDAKKKHEADLVAANDAHRAEIANITDELKSAEELKQKALIEELTKAHEDTIGSLKSALEQAPDIDELDVLKKELFEYRAENTKNAQDFQNLQDSLVQLSHVKEALQIELESQKAAKEEAVSKLQELESLAAQFQTDKDSLTEQLNNLNAELALSKERADADVKALESIYTIQIEELESERKSLKEKLGNVDGGLKERESALETAIQDAAALKHELEAARKEKEAILESMASEMGTLKREKELALEMVEKEFESRGKENSIVFEAALQAVKSDCDSLRTEAEAIRQQLEASEREKKIALEEAEKNNIAIEVALREKESTFEATLKETSIALENAIKDKAYALEKITKEKEEALEAIFIAKKAALEAAESEKSCVENELKATNDKLVTFQGLFQEKEGALGKVNEEVRELEAQIKSLMERAATAEALVQEKAAALENAAKESEAKLKVLIAESAEQKLALKRKEEELSASQSPPNADMSRLQAQITALEGENEHLKSETTRMLNMIENIRPKSPVPSA